MRLVGLKHRQRGVSSRQQNFSEHRWPTLVLSTRRQCIRRALDAPVATRSRGVAAYVVSSLQLLVLELYKHTRPGQTDSLCEEVPEIYSVRSPCRLSRPACRSSLIRIRRAPALPLQMQPTTGSTTWPYHPPCTFAPGVCPKHLGLAIRTNGSRRKERSAAIAPRDMHHVGYPRGGGARTTYELVMRDDWSEVCLGLPS